MDIRRPLCHSMLRRCHSWDYCAPAIYMVTLTLADRSHPLLGRVEPILPSSGFPCPPEAVQARLIPSELGKAILAHWASFQNHISGVKPLFLQLMEEHLHGILHVTQRLAHPLGNAIGGFKTWCNKLFRQMTGDAENRLFSDGFQDMILMHRNQLRRMFDYLRDNPRRLALKRLFPGLFTLMHLIPFGDGAFAGIGNRFLLEKPLFHRVQVSRSISTETPAFNALLQETLAAINDGAVIVSPCFSHGEKELAQQAFARDAPLIVMRDNGFSPLYKPPGKYFDACAQGRLLMLAPSGWPYIPGRMKLTRERACVLNELTRRIACEGKPIHYASWAPENLERLVQEAMHPDLR